MIIPGFVTIVVMEVSYVWQNENSFIPKCHGCVFFCSETWCDKRYCMRWSCFVRYLTTGRSLMVVSLLYEMQTPCNCFTLSLCIRDSCRRNSWWDDHNTTMEIKVSRRWWWRSWRCFGDGDQKHKMMMTIWCHIFWFMWCLSFMHLILLSTMVAL